MKNLLIAIVLLLTVSSCLPDKKDKDKDPEPELAGTYQVSQFKVDNITYIPNSVNASAVVVVTGPAADNKVEVSIRTTENGSTSTTSLEKLPIRKASGRDYDILNGSNTRVGSINGTDFTLDFTGNGQRYLIVARK